MPIYQGRGSLVPKVNPEDFIVRADVITGSFFKGMERAQKLRDNATAMEMRKKEFDFKKKTSHKNMEIADKRLSLLETQQNNASKVLDINISKEKRLADQAAEKELNDQRFANFTKSGISVGLTSPDANDIFDSVKKMRSDPAYTDLMENPAISSFVNKAEADLKADKNEVHILNGQAVNGMTAWIALDANEKQNIGIASRTDVILSGVKEDIDKQVKTISVLTGWSEEKAATLLRDQTAAKYEISAINKEIEKAELNAPQSSKLIRKYSGMAVVKEGDRKDAGLVRKTLEKQLDQYSARIKSIYETTSNSARRGKADDLLLELDAIKTFMSSLQQLPITETENIAYYKANEIKALTELYGLQHLAALKHHSSIFNKYEDFAELGLFDKLTAQEKHVQELREKKSILEIRQGATPSLGLPQPRHTEVGGKVFNPQTGLYEIVTDKVDSQGFNITEPIGR